MPFIEPSAFQSDAMLQRAPTCTSPANHACARADFSEIAAHASSTHAPPARMNSGDSNRAISGANCGITFPCRSRLRAGPVAGSPLRRAYRAPH
jgi:hypothetical protein